MLVEPVVPVVPEPEVDPVVSDELPVVPVEPVDDPLLLGDVIDPLELGEVVVEPLELGEVVVELLPDGAGVVVVERVVVDVLVSRPSVRLRSEHAPSAMVASAAATATPIARVFK